MVSINRMELVCINAKPGDKEMRKKNIRSSKHISSWKPNIILRLYSKTKDQEKLIYEEENVGLIIVPDIKDCFKNTRN